MYQFDSFTVESSALRHITMITTGYDNPVYLIGDKFIDSVTPGFQPISESGHITCYVERPMLALPEFSETTECALCGKGMAKYDCWHIRSFGDLCQHCYSATSRIFATYEY